MTRGMEILFDMDMNNLRQEACLTRRSGNVGNFSTGIPQIQRNYHTKEILLEIIDFILFVNPCMHGFLYTVHRKLCIQGCI